jgi:hypothetical protein
MKTKNINKIYTNNKKDSHKAILRTVLAEG